VPTKWRRYGETQWHEDIPPSNEPIEVDASSDWIVDEVRIGFSPLQLLTYVVVAFYIGLLLAAWWYHR
jgi:hypothetical protein